ncbi:unnamed protein product [Prorocentrum cordatum]|uniref:K Homology domain-containing protein n=1 Tax=Prorocentrum cordatum TaxID=2364126 RepID=A0ABN9U0N6_9DINO|nr:unnamed protein product [Polarella glacialis]
MGTGSAWADVAIGVGKQDTFVGPPRGSGVSARPSGFGVCDATLATDELEPEGAHSERWRFRLEYDREEGPRADALRAADPFNDPAPVKPHGKPARWMWGAQEVFPDVSQRVLFRGRWKSVVAAPWERREVIHIVRSVQVRARAARKQALSGSGGNAGRWTYVDRGRWIREAPPGADAADRKAGAERRRVIFVSFMAFAKQECLAATTSTGVILAAVGCVVFRFLEGPLRGFRGAAPTVSRRSLPWQGCAALAAAMRWRGNAQAATVLAPSLDADIAGGAEAMSSQSLAVDAERAREIHCEVVGEREDAGIRAFLASGNQRDVREALFRQLSRARGRSLAAFQAGDRIAEKFSRGRHASAIDACIIARRGAVPFRAPCCSSSLPPRPRPQFLRPGAAVAPRAAGGKDGRGLECLDLDALPERRSLVIDPEQFNWTLGKKGSTIQAVRDSCNLVYASLYRDSSSLRFCGTRQAVQDAGATVRDASHVLPCHQADGRRDG